MSSLIFWVLIVAVASLAHFNDAFTFKHFGNILRSRNSLNLHRVTDKVANSDEIRSTAVDFGKALILSSLILIGGPYQAGVAPANADTVPQLTAKDVLRSDVEPKTAVLKDILFTFKLYPDYISNGDYASFRQALRQSPAADLRKTCRLLKKYLPSEVQGRYQSAYDVMIDAVNEMDVTAFKRMQGEGLPKKGKTDEQMKDLLSQATEKLQVLVEIASSATGGN
jgi:hypothetical protein